MRQVVGRIAEWGFGNEFDQPGRRVPHRIPFAVFALMHTSTENDPGLSGIIERLRSVPPAAGGKEQRHREEFFSIRRRTRGQPCSVGFTMPGKIILVAPIRMLHEHLGELPQPVEFLFLVHLNGHHHPVGHAL
ncbi:hypothetical protein D3C87_1714880 [compost metagenome]